MCTVEMCVVGLNFLRVSHVLGRRRRPGEASKQLLRARGLGGGRGIHPARPKLEARCRHTEISD